jgi:uncharacterized glyoxalase superfamily protein PhnB
MKLNPDLNFDGTCQDAMETYAKILGGEFLAMMRFDEMPGEQSFRPKWRRRSCMRGEDGQWFQFVTAHCRREA